MQPAKIKDVFSSVFNYTKTKVVPFSSTELKKNYKKKYKVNIDTGSGTQMHHKIPKSLKYMKELKFFNFDQPSNAIPLRSGLSSDITMGTTHRGSHPNYNEAIKSVIETLARMGHHPREIQHAVMVATERILGGSHFTLSFKEPASEIEDIIMKSLTQNYVFSNFKEIDKLDSVKDLD